jgi:hypothetical protein
MASVERRQGNKVQVISEDCKKPLDLGLHGEELSSQVRSPERHFNGARAFNASERAYNGGASVVDLADRE